MHVYAYTHVHICVRAHVSRLSAPGHSWVGWEVGASPPQLMFLPLWLQSPVPFPCAPSAGTPCCPSHLPNGHTGPHQSPLLPRPPPGSPPPPPSPRQSLPQPWGEGWRPAAGRGTVGLPHDVRSQGGPRCPSSSGRVPAAPSTNPIPGWGLGHPIGPPRLVRGLPRGGRAQGTAVNLKPGGAFPANAEAGVAGRPQV